MLAGGWALRLAGGCTKRANAASALAPAGPFAEVRQAAESLYARHGLPAIFRISPLAGPDADAELEAAGYRRHDPSLVMTAPLTAAGAGPEDLHLDPAPTDAWLAGIAEANDIAPPLRPAHARMLQAIALPAAFATRHAGGTAIGFGLGVVERGAVGLFDIAVAPAVRGRGHGRAITQALLGWGRQAGADSAYLQVREGNAVARRLYDSLGFRPAYRYHYRMPG
ncbi:MAG: GNAT family N-acetyltransferase [Sneathiellaceae bacterium]